MSFAKLQYLHVCYLSSTCLYCSVLLYPWFVAMRGGGVCFITILFKSDILNNSLHFLSIDIICHLIKITREPKALSVIITLMLLSFI